MTQPARFFLADRIRQDNQKFRHDHDDLAGSGGKKFVVLMHADEPILAMRDMRVASSSARGFC